MNEERELFSENLDEEPTLQKELTWGLSYRDWKQVERSGSIPQKTSPINIPFQLCKAFKILRKKQKQKKQKCLQELTLLEKSALPQNQYMELLSIPTCCLKKERKTRKKKIKKNKKCCKCKLALCRPRLIQMSIPNKRLVWENWKAYQHSLPAEILMRYDQILKSGDNLEPSIARCYFKNLQKENRRKLRKKRRQKHIKKNEEKKGEEKWLEEQVDELVEDIVKFIEGQPLLMLNFQQMMTSNELLRFFSCKKVFKVAKRTTKNMFKKSLIEISDKLVKWMDNVNFYTDLQPLDSKEKIGVLEMPSAESLVEEIEESEEGEERFLTDILTGMVLEEGEGEEDFTGRMGMGVEDESFEAKKILDKTKGFDTYEDEDEAGFMNLLGALDEDILEKLIQILSQSSPEYLESFVDNDNMPGITYGDVLEKLKEIRDGHLLEKQLEKIVLEDKMIEWANLNDPDRVDDKVLDKIHETSRILDEWFRSFDAAKYKKLHGEGGLWEEGEGGEDDYDASKRGFKTISEEDEEGDEFGLRGKEYGEEGEDEDRTIVEGGMGAGMGLSEDEDYLEGEDGLGPTGMKVFGAGRGKGVGEGEGEGEGLFEGGEGEFISEEDRLAAERAQREGEELGSMDLEKLDSLLDIIRGHKPSKVFEHMPGTICCLSLKIWAVWLLKIANNAHNWTRWIGDIIKQIRQYAAVIRGDVVTPSGEKQVLYKQEWRRFVKDADEKIIAWRQYSNHVKQLSNEIMENFHDKKVNCCPKCLQDHLIKNVVTAHETLQALTEAINCAGYWQRCLDKIVEQTSKFTDIDMEEDKSETISDDSFSIIEIEELSQMPTTQVSETSYDSILEIEELEVMDAMPNVFDIMEIQVPVEEGIVEDVSPPKEA